jgi:hypothetical protein
MKKTINITNHTTIEAHGNHTNGNCKKVYIVEKNMVCTSMTDAAEIIGCSLDAVSNVIRGKQRTCRGYHIIDLSKAGEAFPQMVSCLSEVGMLRTETRTRTEISRKEMAEFRKWKAEQKAKEKAQKRKEKREAEKVKLQAYIQKHTMSAEKKYAEWESEQRKIMKAERRYEALMDKEVL